MSEPQPWTPAELSKLPTRLDIYRSTLTGKLFELIDISYDGLASICDIESMLIASIPYDKFRQFCITEPEFIGENR